MPRITPDMLEKICACACQVLAFRCLYPHGVQV
jgi:hypothetical protein